MRRRLTTARNVIRRWHHDRVDADLTLAEAATLLHPPMTERQLRMIIRALGWQPAGIRRSDRPGRRTRTYQAAEIMRLHQALTPWLKLMQKPCLPAII